MKRKTSPKPCIVHKYGCWAPTANVERVDEQILLGHQMHNELVEAEHKNRETYRNLLEQDSELNVLTARLNALKSEAEALRVLIKKKRSTVRQRKVDTSTEKERLAAIKAERKELSPKLKEARVAARERLKVEVGALQEQEKAKTVEIRRAYAAKGLFWPTYNAVIESAESGKKKTRKTGVLPHFHRFDGSGRICFQVQGGLPVEQLFTANRRIELDPVPEGSWNTRHGRRHGTKTVMRFRVGSDENRAPIFAELPINIHRPFPPGAICKSAQVNRRRVGRHFVWTAQFTLELPAAARPRPMRRMVALDLGWRKRGDAYRCAYSYDHDGKHAEVLLPADYCATYPHLDSLASIRGDNFQAIRDQLVKYRQENEQDVPTWFKTETRHMYQWRAPRKMTRLLGLWSRPGHRFDGDAVPFEALKAYVKQDLHLWDWESRKRRNVAGRRNDLFANIAAQIARDYDVVFVEDINWRDDIKKAAVEDDKDRQTDEMRRAKAICAPGSLVHAIANAMAKNGGHLVRVDPAKTTRICHVCDHDGEWDQAKLDHTCKNCGHTWDQDHNAAINIFRWGLNQCEGDVKKAA